MATQIYENLSKKSSNELKAYIVNMSDGYKPEAVEAAIAILKERGEDIDDILRSAQVEVCARCNNRQQSKEGLICKLTDKKADFICTCPSYSCDEAASAEQERVKYEKSGWGWMMSFYWFVLAAGAVLTTIMTFTQFKPSEGLFYALADLVLQLGYAALCVYTIVAFSKRLPNAVALGKIQNFLLIAMNVFIILLNMVGGETDWYSSSARLINSIFWSTIFLVYLYTNTKINAILPKESRHMLKYDKPIIWSIGGIVVALFLAGIVETAANELNQPINDLKSYVEEYQKTLTVDKTANSYCKSVEVGKNAVIINQHSNTYTNAELPAEAKEYLPVYTKEMMFFYPESYKDMLELCYAANYGVSMCWYDIDDEFTYSIDWSAADVSKIFEDSVHVTSNDDWSAFLSGWNKQFPLEYLGSEAYYTSAEIQNGTAIINIAFVGIPASELKHFTGDYLKSYLQENFEDLRDHFMTLAMLNRMPICFSFSSDASDLWHKTATFTREELYY